MKKSYLLIIILIIFLLTVPFLRSITSDDRSYSISKATFDLYVEENGTLKVRETLHYSFKGTYKGVYRDIPVYPGERLENINVTTNGAYSFFEVTNKTNLKSVKVYLYADEYRLNPITDRDVDVIITYNFINVITIYNDIAELHFKVWGEYWDVKVEQIETNVHLSSSEGVRYWLNPPYYVKNSAWKGSVLNILTNPIYPGNYFEVRLSIPTEQFNNPINAGKENINALTQIEKIQEDYQNNINFYSTLYYLLSILMLTSIIIPIWIYYKYGREPETTYTGEYEREPPTDDPPALVNAISGKGFHKNVGSPDMDGLQATIMDLINRGYLLIESADSGKKDKKSVILKFKKYAGELDMHEIDVMTLLRGFSEGGVLNLDNMKKKLKDKDKALQFKKYYDDWQEDFKRQYLDESKVGEFFISVGNKYMKIYGVLALATAGAVYYFIRSSPLPAAYYTMLASIILAVAAVIILILPPKIGGRWTQKGVDYHAQWQAFKKYLQDFSLIKEYPPESVAVWNKYLVYATALGIADEVRKSMETSLSEEQLSQSNLYQFHYYGGYALLSSGLSTGMSTATGGSDGGGGVGGAGGGSGGGGGGAF